MEDSKLIQPGKKNLKHREVDRKGDPFYRNYKWIGSLWVHRRRSEIHSFTWNNVISNWTLNGFFRCLYVNSNHRADLTYIPLNRRLNQCPLVDPFHQIESLKLTQQTLAGWWYAYPSEKYDESSIGIMTFPTYGKSKKNHGSKQPTSFGIPKSKIPIIPGFGRRSLHVESSLAESMW